MLLTGEGELAAEDVRGSGKTSIGVASRHRRLCTLEAPRGDRLGNGENRRQRVVVDLHRQGAQPRGLESLGEYPAHCVPVEADLTREERLVMLGAGVVHSGHVVRREHADDPLDLQRRVGAQRGHPCVGDRDLHGIGMQDVAQTVDEIVGVQRLTGHVQARTLVRQGLADDGNLWTF
jgi:hypothetical protein